MKVILKKDNKKLGKAGDIKEVSTGYAVNFLFKTGVAVPATAHTIKEAEKKKEHNVKKQETEKQKAEEIFKKLNHFKIRTKMKFGEGDTSFGSVSENDIQELLREKGFEVDKKNIIMESHIKTMGEHKVKIKLGFDMEAEPVIIVDKE